MSRPAPGPVRPPSGPTSRPVVYHVARRSHRRWPAVLLATLALPVVVAAQVIVGTAAPDRPDPATIASPEATPTASAGPTKAPGLLPAPSTAPEDLVVVPEVTVRFAAGAVLDDEAVDALGPVADVLSDPDATAVLVLGSAEPGPDEAAALRLAQERADAVRQALLDTGADQQLVRTRAVVDAALGRAVVVSPEVP